MRESVVRELSRVSVFRGVRESGVIESVVREWGEWRESGVNERKGCVRVWVE